MTITPDRAAGAAVHNGTTYYFCSKSCLERFRANPQSFMSKVASAPTAPPTPRATDSPAEYTCPMHPEVRENRSGSCPKCGMALEPVTPVVRPQRQEWTCPMHPQIVRDGPGTCPICGMTLEPRTVLSADEQENPELRDMTRRLWLAAAFAAPLVILA